jgi:hypothetical protein
MIDMFSLALSHGLMLVAAWRLVMRADLDNDRTSPDGLKKDILGRPIGAGESGGDA